MLKATNEEKVGITDYEMFARSVLESVTDKPISFEVFSDDFPQMRGKALKIRDWQDNVYLKIPITNTKGDSALLLINVLAAKGVKPERDRDSDCRHKVGGVAEALAEDVPAVVSVFAGRVADGGLDPIPLMKESLQLLSGRPQAALPWASSVRCSTASARKVKLKNPGATMLGCSYT